MPSVILRSKRPVIIAILTLTVSVGNAENGGSVGTQKPGEHIFQTICFACHTIGGGRRVGPDLLSVHDRRSQAWLEKFVKSSQSMVNSGNHEAIALFEEFNRIPMPDPALSEQQIREVLVYIQSRSTAQITASGANDRVPETVAAPVSEQPVSEQDILMGQKLFQGNIRLANNGPACNACHEVRNDAVIGGGILARELTEVFSRMGRAGVTAILGQAPFPVMQAAYKNRPLTAEEAAALVAFLQFADSEQQNHLPRDYGIGLLLSGAAGALVLLMIFNFVWRGRKKEPVNQKIFDRQIRSVSDQ